MEIKELKDFPEEDKTGIVGLAIITEMFSGYLVMALNRKYYPLHLFRKSNYKKRRERTIKERYYYEN